MLLTSESQIMRWGRVFTILIVLFLLSGSEAFAIKPSPPLKLSLVNRDLTDGQIEITFHAQSFVAAEKVELAIDLPPSVSLVSGDIKWDGSIAVGEKKAVKAFIRTLSNIPAKVVGKGIAHFTHGGSVTQQEILLLNPPQEKASSPRDVPIKRKQGGETLLEFRGK